MTEQEAGIIYGQILEGYLESPEEAYLYQAAQLGRRLLQKEAHPEAVVEMHAQAIEGVTKGFSLAKQMEAVRQAFAPLTEVMMAYGLASREQLEERKQVEEELRRYREHLEELVEERTFALRESEEKFRQFFENEPAYCYMVSPEGTVLDVNRAALKTLGYSKEEMVGKPLKTIYAPESLPKMKQLLAKWKETGQLRDEEMVILTKNGDERTVLPSAGVVKGEDGSLLLIPKENMDGTYKS